MKRKSFKKQQSRCTRYFDEWLRIMGLLWYEISINYHADSADFQKDNGDETIMRTWVKWQYMHFEIDVNLPAVKRLSDDKLESCIVHELCHVLVNEMRAAGEVEHGHEERVVTMLAKAFLWTRKLQREETE